MSDNLVSEKNYGGNFYMYGWAFSYTVNLKFQKLCYCNWDFEVRIHNYTCKCILNHYHYHTSIELVYSDILWQQTASGWVLSALDAEKYYVHRTFTRIQTYFYVLCFYTVLENVNLHWCLKKRKKKIFISSQYDFFPFPSKYLTARAAKKNQLPSFYTDLFSFFCL